MSDRESRKPPKKKSQPLGWKRLQGNSGAAWLANDRPDASFPPPPDRRTSVERTFVRWKRGLMGRIFDELKARRSEALRLYRPMPEQERYHASKATFRILRGGNRGGKTLAAMVELARAATGQDPHNKYKKQGLRIIVVAKDANAIGEVIVRKLLRKGSFQMLRDAETGEWRAVNPADPADQAREQDWRPCPPLIPERLIVSKAWDRQNRSILHTLKLVNDIEIRFASGEAEPIQGVDVDFVLFDEEIKNDEWFKEARFRIVDRRGRLSWSATPQNATVQFHELWELSKQGNPAIADFCVKTRENKHLSKEQIDDITSTVTSEEEMAVRLDGEFKISGVIVFGAFDRGTHTVSEEEVFVSGAPPRDWCIYFALDPGVNPLAGLFVGIPPDMKRYYVFDELYLSHASIDAFGDAMERKLKPLQMPEEFIIDIHGARLTGIGHTETPLTMFQKELTKRGIASRVTGSSFFNGCDNELTRINASKRWLEIDGKTRLPKLAVVRERCPNFLMEIRKYAHKRGPSGLVLTETQKGYDHLMDCWGMIAARGPIWNPPRTPAAKLNPVVASLRKKQRQAGRGQRTDYRNLGPVST